jgi:two-component system, chemotaxis family, protein-glutamate methylesterase/glutaminase
MASGARLRVLVCDDSPLMRRILSDLLTEAGLNVVGYATNGAELAGRVAELKPDVVTLDVEMPKMDGIAAVADLMKKHPTPVVMVSSLTANGAAATIRAMEAGAVDAIQKPSARTTADAWLPVRDELVAKLRAAAAVRLTALSPAPKSAAPGARLASRARAVTNELVIIASSTGGPRALAQVVPRLPSPLGAGVLIVQHMPPGFTASLAERLNQSSALTVREAKATDEIRPDTALVAPAGWHLEVTAPGRVRRSSDPPIGALRPRADVTYASAAKHYGGRILCVVLTGMGNDGEAGIREVKRRGGVVLAEDESTCVVYGMPRAVVDAGLSDATFPLDAMAIAISESVARSGS